MKDNRVCVICNEYIWNLVSPKKVILHALYLLEKPEDRCYLLKRLREELKPLEICYKDFKLCYLNNDIYLPICWGCIFEIIYNILKEIDEEVAEKFKKYADPTGL